MIAENVSVYRDFLFDRHLTEWPRTGNETGKETGNETGNETEVIQMIQKWSRGQVTGQVAGQVKESVRRIVLAIGGQTLTRKEIMEILSLKGRDNFRNSYLEPSMIEGFVSKLYPDSDNRPDQAYYLTEKGLELFSELQG